jgi:benzoylformate decarboxylase
MPYFGGSNLLIEPQVKLIQIRMDPQNLARVYPGEYNIVADIKAALTELIEEIRTQSSPRKLQRTAATRMERARAYHAEREETLRQIARERWDNNPISGERVAMELEAELDRDAVIVSENDTYKFTVQNYLSYGTGEKDLFENGGAALGWGLGAAFGVKLALPERPVVAVVSDGSFLFSGPQPLWTYCRHKAPITVVVLNNQSYNNERNRILAGRGRAYETGRDMVCYLGDPDVDYAAAAGSFGVEGEIVNDPAEIQAALQRAKHATEEGRPYLLDVHVERTGSLATSTWHPEFHIAASNAWEV